MTLDTTIDERPAPSGSRQQAMDAAAELLATRGLAELTIDAVANHAGTTRAIIQRLWPNEEALALDVLRHEWLELAAQVYGGACRFGLR
jgi:AcrR family transcriptional regulator